MDTFIANVCSNLTYDQLERLQWEMCVFNTTAFEQCSIMSMFIMKWF